jgi:excinuclease ABC subunit B
LTDEVVAERAEHQPERVAEQKAAYNVTGTLPPHEIEHLIGQLEKQMKAAAAELEFEKAALYRDQIAELREQLKLIKDAADPRPAWEKLR